MEQKKLIGVCMFIGSIAGGYIPSLWDASIFSLSSVVLSAVGGFIGIWVGYRMGD